jgi:hypothetical protein
MAELIISAVVAALLVILEALGNLVSRWAVARRLAEESGVHAAAEAALRFDRAMTGSDVSVGMEEEIRRAHRQARAVAFRKLIGSFVPGPELCYMALTLQITLFLGFNYANDVVRKAISPFLAASRNAFPILLGLTIVNAISWVGTNLWREAIVEGLQARWRKLSVTTIVALGGGNLAAMFYLVIKGRV